MDNTEKKKRGRKKKSDIIMSQDTTAVENIQIELEPIQYVEIDTFT
jgi:hypothetical protein